MNHIALLTWHIPLGDKLAYNARNHREAGFMADPVDAVVMPAYLFLLCPSTNEMVLG
jgi:hypothetical protein